jgi:hypothetical protein
MGFFYEATMQPPAKRGPSGQCDNVSKRTDHSTNPDWIGYPALAIDDPDDERTWN